MTKIFFTLVFSIFIVFFNSCNKSESNKNNIKSQKTESLNTDMKVEEKIILAFGDSLTAGYELPIEYSYPSLLENKIQENGFNYKVINSGVSGETTSGALERVDWVLKSNPKIVILEFGANDAFRAVPIEKVRKNLSTLIEKIKENNSQIILAGMKAPRNLGSDYYTKFDSIYPELAKKYDLELIPFFLDKVSLKPNLNIGDGIHPNKEGYKIVTETVWNYLKPILEK